MTDQTNKTFEGWSWIPSLYFAEAVPYMMVNVISVIMYKNLGLSNTDIALYTSYFYLPWVIKPFWSPIVDMFKTKRYWILVTQLFVGAGLAGVALTLPAENYFKYTMVFFYLIAFGSATHDIAADGFYMIGLSESRQAFFVGIRNTFYRVGMWFCQGLLVMLVGYVAESSDMKFAWSIAMGIVAAMFILFVIYHNWVFPKETERTHSNNLLREFIDTFVTFFKKKNIIIIVAFLLFYRFGEGQLLKVNQLFFIDPVGSGGLGLSNIDIGVAYGTVGLIALIIGGIIGGIVVSRNGLKYWIWWLLIAMNLPNVVYVYMSFFQPESLWIISACVAVEQFGYGLGFTAYVMFMIYVSKGEHKTSHYAIATGLMALGMMLPGAISGWIQEMIGYKMFFVWVLVSAVPIFLITGFVKIEPEFGRK